MVSRRARVAIVASVAAHAIGVAAVASFDPPPPFRAPIATPAAPPIAEPIDVAIVELPPDPPAPPVATVAAAATSPRMTTRSGRAAMTADATAPAEAGGTGALAATTVNPVTSFPATGEASGAGVGDLRVIPSATADRIVATTRAPEAVVESGRIAQNGRQRYVDDLQVPATINDDGTVAFHDKGDFEMHWMLKPPSAKQIGDRIADWYKDPYAQTIARSVQEMAPHEQAVDPTVVGGPGGWDAGAGGDGRPDGTKEQPGAPRAGGPPIPILGGSFDITAWAMRKFQHADPYASRKRKLLADTFDQRVEIGARHTKDQYARTGEVMMRNLARVGAIADVAARHAALFEMWDECVEGDGAQAEAGARARAMIVGWIRAHETFSADEIAQFDARRTSKQHFSLTVEE